MLRHNRQKHPKLAATFDELTTAMDAMHSPSCEEEWLERKTVMNEGEIEKLTAWVKKNAGKSLPENTQPTNLHAQVEQKAHEILTAWNAFHAKKLQSTSLGDAIEWKDILYEFANERQTTLLDIGFIQTVVRAQLEGTMDTWQSTMIRMNFLGRPFSGPAPAYYQLERCENRLADKKEQKEQIRTGIVAGEVLAITLSVVLGISQCLKQSNDEQFLSTATIIWLPQVLVAALAILLGSPIALLEYLEKRRSAQTQGIIHTPYYEKATKNDNLKAVYKRYKDIPIPAEVTSFVELIIQIQELISELDREYGPDKAEVVAQAMTLMKQAQEQIEKNGELFMTKANLPTSNDTPPGKRQHPKELQKQIECF